MFPTPARVPTRPCPRCRHPVRVDRAIHGFGEDCAQKLGLTGRTTDTGQDGPDLLDLLEGDDVDEPDSCDGWDR